MNPNRYLGFVEQLENLATLQKEDVTNYKAHISEGTYTYEQLCKFAGVKPNRNVFTKQINEILDEKCTG